MGKITDGKPKEYIKENRTKMFSSMRMKFFIKPNKYKYEYEYEYEEQENYPYSIVEKNARYEKPIKPPTPDKPKEEEIPDMLKMLMK